MSRSPEGGRIESSDPERYFRVMIEGASDIVLRLSKDMVVEYVSPSVSRVLGWEPAEVIGKKPRVFMHPDDVADAEAGFANAVGGAAGAGLRAIRYRHKDGGWRTLEVTRSNYLADPLIRGVVVYARDVTERDRLTEQLVQAQKMESIGRIAAGIAHDVNNILTIIGGAAESLLRLEASGPGRENALAIRDAVSRGAALARDLLSFGRPTRLEPKPIDLRNTVQNIVPLLRRALGERIELAAEAGPGTMCIRADAGQLEHALINLAANARDAMPCGGQFTLRVHDRWMDGTRWVVISASDTGHGIAPEVRGRIFEPFFTTKRSGTGLGLSTVYAMVGSLGGDIEVTSTPGQGSRFDLRFPALDLAEECDQATSALPPLPFGSGESIVVVEDDPRLRLLVRRMLTAAGYAVTEAGSADEAAAILADLEVAPDLILSDVGLPDRDGGQVAAEARARWPDLPVLFMSGFAPEDLKARGIAVETLLRKPFDSAELVTAVATKVAKTGRVG